MHTCPPPIDLLRDWLEATPSLSRDFAHLLLEQQNGPTASLLAGLRAYFESAHQDARNRFHAFAAIDLHPDANGIGAAVLYPQSLPRTTRHGLFGEVMAGLIAQSYPFVNDRRWQVPFFLFRHHEDAKYYIFNLSQNPANVRQVLGRHGTDFIGIELNDDGTIVSYINGEAKWRKSVQPSVVQGIMLGSLENGVRTGGGVWDKFNHEIGLPPALRQLQELMVAYAPERFAAAILSIDRAITQPQANPIGRCDYVLVVGTPAVTRARGDRLLPWDQAPPEYTAGHEVQLVELVIPDGDELIAQLYDMLWIPVEEQDAA